MKYGKKLVLVDYKAPTVPQPLREMQPQPITPIINDPIMSTGEYLSMRKIDRDMRTILRRKNLSDRDKVMLYGGLMRRFGIIKDENRRQLNQQRNESLHSLKEYLHEPNSQQQQLHTTNDMNSRQSLLTDDEEVDDDDEVDDEEQITIIPKQMEPTATSTPKRANESMNNKSKKNKSKHNTSGIRIIENQRMTRADARSKGIIHKWDELLANNVKRISKKKKS